MAINISGNGDITGINSLNTDVSATELGYLDGIGGSLLTDPGVWKTYSPTVSSGSGTITTVSSSGRYAKIGKTIFVRGSVSITNAGTGAAGLFVTVPIAAQSGGPSGSAAETNATGWACSCWLNNTTQLHIYRYDGSTIIANNRTVNFSITYEVA